MISLSNKISSQCSRYHLSKSCTPLISVIAMKAEMSTSTSSLKKNDKSSKLSPNAKAYPLQESVTHIDQKALEKQHSQVERQKFLQERSESNARFKTYLDSLPELIYPNFYKVDCIRDLDEANDRVSQLAKTEKVFGVDLEWPPTFVKGQPEKKTSLVQICSANNILLIQIGRMQRFPIELKRFFEDKQVLKSGVNIGADGLKLYRDFGIKTNGLVELRDVAEIVKSPKLKISHLRSLRALTGIFMDQNMAKGKVRISNWNKSDLTDVQIKYAALDAYASYKLYVILNDMRDKSKPITVRHLSQEIPHKPVESKKVKGILNVNKSSAYDNRSSPVSTTVIIRKPVVVVEKSATLTIKKKP